MVSKERQEELLPTTTTIITTLQRCWERNGLLYQERERNHSGSGQKGIAPLVEEHPETLWSSEPFIDQDSSSTTALMMIVIIIIIVDQGNSCECQILRGHAATSVV